MKHWDEARSESEKRLRELVDAEPHIERAVLIDDIFGKVRVVAWLAPGTGPEVGSRIADAMQAAAGPFWSGDLWIASGASDADSAVYEAAWKEGVEVTCRLRRADRHRTRGFWVGTPTAPPWLPPEGLEFPPIVAFYSFKGGVGRTTALASFAIQRALEGERVVVVDLDLEAPGAGTLLGPGEGLPGARWGVVDYLLEQPVVGRLDLRDYYHTCIAGMGSPTAEVEVLVVPAGRLDQNYLGKLARLDLEPPLAGDVHPLVHLLRELKEELTPRWILLDCRAGLSEAAGFVLSGLAHLYVLFGTPSQQSWQGLRMIIERLGAERIRREQPQVECLLVQAMVPEHPDTAASSKSDFEAEAFTAFSELYYAADPEDPEEDRFWYMRDIDSPDAPHVPIPVGYKTELAFVQSLEEVADTLCSDEDFKRMTSRIASRFVGEEQ
jgi:cellulose biosynthesis protein BcsQ